MFSVFAINIIGMIAGYVITYLARKNYWITIQQSLEIENHKQKLFETQERLIQTQKMESIGRLAGGIAHDYNNYLGAIIGSTELLMHNMIEDEEEKQSLLQNIYNAAQTSAKITKQLLTFARKAEFNPVPIQPNSVLMETILLLDSVFRTSTKVISSLDPDVSPILFEESQLKLELGGEV